MGRNGDTPRLSAEQYRLLVEHSPALIWRVASDGRCDYLNAAWLAFTGRAFDDEIGDGWLASIHPDDAGPCVDTFESHFRLRQPFEMEYRLRRHDGVYRWVADRGVPIVDASGAFDGFIGSCIDVDERREAARAKATFIALIAHELRTPLTAIKAYLEVVRRRLARREPLQDLLVRLDTQVERTANFARELGDAVALEAGRPLSLRLGDVDLAGLVRRVVAAAGPGAADRRQSIALRAPDGPVCARGDAERLTQALASLLENACKFSPPGGRIDVRLEHEGDEQVLSVEDGGIGIPRDEIAAVTRGYYRASNAPAAHYPGVGLGLAVCKAIIERHGGRLTIRSGSGKGTTVSVALPAGCTAS